MLDLTWAMFGLLCSVRFLWTRLVCLVDVSMSVVFPSFPLSPPLPSPSIHSPSDAIICFVCNNLFVVFPSPLPLLISFYLIWTSIMFWLENDWASISLPPASCLAKYLQKVPLLSTPPFIPPLTCQTWCICLLHLVSPTHLSPPFLLALYANVVIAIIFWWLLDNIIVCVIPLPHHALYYYIVLTKDVLVCVVGLSLVPFVVIFGYCI